MCLLGIVPQKSERQAVTTEWLRDIYAKNPDGYGFAWYTPSHGVHVYKAVGKFREFKRAWRQMELHSGAFAFHVRLRTHGAVSKEMAHPYPVGETGLHLFHNGILAHGNHADKGKSDTWHYINDVLLPLHAKIGDNVLMPQLLDMMGHAIGNNRFIIIDKQGQFHFVNKHQGVEWNGMWLSNTYAWSAYKFGYSRRTSIVDDLDDGFSWDDWRTWARGKDSKDSKGSKRSKAEKAGATVTTQPVRALSGPTQVVKPGEVIGSLLDTTDNRSDPSHDFVQLLYTLGYTDAANEISHADVDEYTRVFGLDGLDKLAEQIAEFLLDDDEIVVEVKMREYYDDDEGEDDRAVALQSGTYTHTEARAR